MKKSSLLLLVVLVFLAISCKKDKEADPLSCNLETAASEFVEESLQVTYELRASGDYNIASFYYYDESGRIEMENPTVPQDIEVTLTSQKKMQAGATGTVKNGFIEVSYAAETESTTYEGSDRCEQSSQ
jgi:hypothetical protein